MKSQPELRPLCWGNSFARIALNETVKSSVNCRHHIIRQFHASGSHIFDNLLWP
jgi:hypothetical protein